MKSFRCPHRSGREALLQNAASGQNGGSDLKKPEKRLPHKHFTFTGAFAPVDEEVFASDLAVDGELPPDLNGEYVRNGPNRLWNLPSSDCQWHWFFGDGMVHGVRLDKGKATYHNHYLRTGKFMAEQRMGGPVREPVTFSTSWPRCLLTLLGEKLRLFTGYPDYRGYNNTSLLFHNKRAMALCEADLPLELRITLDGHLQSDAHYLYAKEVVSMNAHPKVDPVTGELFWMNYSLTGAPSFYYGTVSPDGQVRTKSWGALKGGKSVMIHDCGVTERHALVLDCAVLTDIRFLDTDGCIWHFDPEHGARVGIFPRDVATGRISEKLIKWFTIETCQIFHIANCWEEDEHTVVMVAVRWNSVNMSGYSDASLFDSTPHMRRWTFRLDTGEVTEERLCKEGAPAPDKVEFPVTHPRYAGRKCRWVWAVGGQIGEPNFHRVYKFDLERGCVAASVAFEREGCQFCGGECSFVPRLGGSAEDDGYLVTFVVDPNGVDNSFLWILDARSMQNAPLAVVSLPARVPLGFHGIWVDEESLQKQREPGSG